MAEEKKIEGFKNIKLKASGLLLVANLTAQKSEIESHQTGVTSSSATVDITNVSVVAAGMTNLRLKIKNGDTPFYLREIGIMAQDPDLGEILYLYTNCGNGAQAFPVFDGSNHVYRTIDFLNIISNASDINVNLTLKNEVTREDFETHRTVTVLDHPDGSVTSEKLADDCVTTEKLASDIRRKFTDINSSINQLNSAIKLINTAVSTTYLKYFFSAQMSDCDDITDWDCASYQEYQTNGYSSSSVLKLTDKSVVLPTKSENPIFFVSYCTDNDDEIEIVQELLYSNGNNYVRRKQWRYYTTGVTAKPKWTEFWKVMYNGNDNRKRISNTGICRQGRRSRNGKRQCRNCGITSESYFKINVRHIIQY